MPVHPAVLEAQLAQVLPRNTVMVQESSTARTTLLSFGHAGMEWTRSESYQIVRHSVGLARSQGVDGEAVTTVKELEPALRRGMDKITRENRLYVIGVSGAREGIGADSTWGQDWQL